MALSVAQFAQVTNWFTTGATTSTKTVTGLAWSAGDIITVISGISDANGTPSVVPTNANLTFGAAQAGSVAGGGNECGVWLYTAVAGSSQSSQTITLTVTFSGGGSKAYGGGVWVVTGAPFGVTNAAANITEANFALNVQPGSVVVYGLMDWAANNPPGKTPATGSGSATERLDQGNGTAYAQYLADWVGTSAGAFSFGPNNYTSLTAAQVVIEILAVEPPVTVTTAGSGNSATSTATVAFDCGAAFAAGDIIVVAISCDNAGTAGVSSLASVADAQGNTYELLQATYDPGAAAAGQTVGIAWALIEAGNELASTDDVTISFSPNTTSKAAVVYRLRPGAGYALTKVTSAFTAGSATGTPTVTTSSITSGDVVIAVLAAESNATVTGDSDTTNGAWSTQITATGSTGTSGTSSRVASQSKVVTGTATQTYNPTITSCDNILGWITFHPGSATADLVVADAFHGSTADAVVLTQVHVLVVADAAHGNTADAVALTQVHVLVVAHTAHGHTVDAVTLTQVHILTVADAAHQHTVEAVTLTQDHVLAVAHTFHGHTSDNVTLTQVHELAGVADSNHEHTVDNVELNVSVDLTVDDTAHGHGVDAATLTQDHNLTVGDASHEHTSENVALTQVHDLVVDDSSHGHEAENVTLAAGAALDVADSFHGHTADTPTLTQDHTLTIGDASHGHTVDNVSLTQDHTLTGLADSAHEHTVDNVTLTLELSLTIADAFHGHTVDHLVLEQFHTLTVADSLHGHTVESLTLTQLHELVVADAFHTHTVDGVNFLGDPTMLRVLVVGYEGRTYIVDAELRTWTITPTESVAVVVDQPRTYIVAPAARVLEVAQ